MNSILVVSRQSNVENLANGEYTTTEFNGATMTHLIRLLLAVSCALCLPLNAQTFTSSFGFSTEISDNWLIVSKDTLTENPDLLNFNMPEFQKMDKAVIEQVKQLASSGQIELLYYKKAGADFGDNINLYIDPSVQSALKPFSTKLCPSLPTQIKQAFNRENNTQVYFCKYTNIYGKEVIAYAYDGALIGTKSYGYYFKAQNKTINLTVTCTISQCESVKSDAEFIFEKMK